MEPVFEGLSANIYLVYVKFSDDCVKTLIAILNSKSDIELSLESTTETTCGAANGALELAVTGQDGSFVLDWSDGTSTSDLTFSNLSSGSYTITVTDEQNCQDSISVEVAASTGVAFDTTEVVQTSCGLDNGRIILSTNSQGANYNLELNGQSGTLSNTDLPAGTYEFTLEDDKGCVDTLSFLLEPSTPVSIDEVLVSSTTCAQDNGSVSAVTASGTPTEYSIDGLTYGPLDSLIGLAPDNYQLFAQNANCADTSTFIIEASALLELQIADLEGTTCGEMNGSVALNVINGTGPYTYTLDSLKQSFRSIL